MKKWHILILLLFCFLPGCETNEELFFEKENFNGNISGQILAEKYDEWYYLNMTDGIIRFKDNGRQAERITNEYSYNFFFREDVMYYSGNADGKSAIKAINVNNRETKVLYSGDSIGCILHFAPIPKGWILVDHNTLLTLDMDGNILSEKTIEHFFSFYSDDKIFLYLGQDGHCIIMYDIEKEEISEVVKTDFPIGETIVFDGVNVYYSVKTGECDWSLCSYNMRSGTNSTIRENKFAKAFNISDNICYYTLAENNVLNMYSLNIDTKECVKLKEYDYSEICDINILEDKLVYRVTSYGKQLEILNLTDNTIISLSNYW